MTGRERDVIRAVGRMDNPEPTATEAAAYVGIKVAEYSCYIIILLAIGGLWVGTPR